MDGSGKGERVRRLRNKGEHDSIFSIYTYRGSAQTAPKTWIRASVTDCSRDRRQNFKHSFEVSETLERIQTAQGKDDKTLCIIKVSEVRERI